MGTMENDGFENNGTVDSMHVPTKRGELQPDLNGSHAPREGDGLDTNLAGQRRLMEEEDALVGGDKEQSGEQNEHSPSRSETASKAKFSSTCGQYRHYFGAILLLTGVIIAVLLLTTGSKSNGRVASPTPSSNNKTSLEVVPESPTDAPAKSIMSDAPSSSDKNIFTHSSNAPTRVADKDTFNDTSQNTTNDTTDPPTSSPTFSESTASASPTIAPAFTATSRPSASPPTNVTATVSPSVSFIDESINGPTNSPETTFPTATATFDPTKSPIAEGAETDSPTTDTSTGETTGPSPTVSPSFAQTKSPVAEGEPNDFPTTAPPTVRSGGSTSKPDTNSPTSTPSGVLTFLPTQRPVARGAPTYHPTSLPTSFTANPTTATTSPISSSPTDKTAELPTSGPSTASPIDSSAFVPTNVPIAEGTPTDFPNVAFSTGNPTSSPTSFTAGPTTATTAPISSSPTDKATEIPASGPATASPIESSAFVPTNVPVAEGVPTDFPNIVFPTSNPTDEATGGIGETTNSPTGEPTSNPAVGPIDSATFPPTMIRTAPTPAEVRSDEGWIQMGKTVQGKIEISDDDLGKSIAISDDGMVVAMGAPQNSCAGSSVSQTGYVRVMRFDDNLSLWNVLGNELTGPSESSSYGETVALSSSGMMLAVGSPSSSGDYVTIYVFNEETNHWDQLGYLLVGRPPNRSDSRFGHLALSANGMTVAVGSRRYDRGRWDLHVYVFRYNTEAEVFEQLGQSLTGKSSDGRFGLSADGSILAFQHESSIGIYRYEESSTSWTPHSTIKKTGWISFAALSGNGRVISSDQGMYQYNETSLAWDEMGSNIRYPQSLSYDGRTIAMKYTEKVGCPPPPTGPDSSDYTDAPTTAAGTRPPTSAPTEYPTQTPTIPPTAYPTVVDGCHYLQHVTIMRFNENSFVWEQQGKGITILADCLKQVVLSGNGLAFAASGLPWNTVGSSYLNNIPCKCARGSVYMVASNE